MNAPVVSHLCKSLFVLHLSAMEGCVVESQLYFNRITVLYIVIWYCTIYVRQYLNVCV